MLTLERRKTTIFKYIYSKNSEFLHLIPSFFRLAVNIESEKAKLVTYTWFLIYAIYMNHNSNERLMNAKVTDANKKSLHLTHIL